MVGRRVRGADGRQWRVGRRWLPWKPRTRPIEAGDALQLGDVGLDLGDGPGGIVLAILLVIGAVLFVVVVLPIVLTILEVLLVVVLLPLFVVARVLLRKPWIVVARTKGPPPEQRTASVSGWRASGQAMEDMAQTIRGSG